VVHSLADDHSRFACSELRRAERRAHRHRLRRVSLAAFAAAGILVRRLLSDNAFVHRNNRIFPNEVGGPSGRGGCGPAADCPRLGLGKRSGILVSPPSSGGALNRFTIGLLSLALVLILPRPLASALLPRRDDGSRLRAGGAAFGFRFRWDLYNLDFTTIPASIAPDGSASAGARDGSLITLTGSGVFGGKPGSVSGGGTWTTYNPEGMETGSGTYRVRALVSFFASRGSSPYPDEIGRPADARAGLATLRVSYSNGQQGILVISSYLPGSPIPVFVGVTASMGAIDFFTPVPPALGTQGGRTIFHLLHR
jgi:hypothetical protein